MCNSKYDYEPKEVNEPEESKYYRKTRGELMDSVSKVKEVCKEIEVRLALSRLSALYQRNENEDKENQKTVEMMQIIATFKIDFTEQDSFHLNFYIPKTKGKKQTIVDLETSFKDEKSKEVFCEIVSFKEFLTEQLKERKVIIPELIGELSKAFCCLEKTFLNFWNI